MKGAADTTQKITAAIWHYCRGQLTQPKISSAVDMERVSARIVGEVEVKVALPRATEVDEILACKDGPYRGRGSKVNFQFGSPR